MPSIALVLTLDFALTAHLATATTLPATMRRIYSTPDGNNVEALYRDVGNVGHGADPALR